MSNAIIGHGEFVDGPTRLIYDDGQGPYVLDDDGERVYGVFLIPEEEGCDPPVIVDPGVQDCPCAGSDR